MLPKCLQFNRSRLHKFALQFNGQTIRSASSLSKRARMASSSSDITANVEKVPFLFIESSTGDKIQVEGALGKTVLEVAIENNVDIEGACGGELACSTCHVILAKELYDSLPPKSEEEQDMLDLAWGVTETSRLCCQIKVSKILAKQEFTVPSETNNML